MNFKIKSVLLLGVGGVSMHQLALAFKSLGVEVFGYDLNKSTYTKICEESGINVVYKFDKRVCNVDLCVKTGAIKNSRFLKYLKHINCPVVDRAEILAWFCSRFKTVIAVAGTHGKSTTASLIYEILRVAGKKVSCHIGADVFAQRFILGDEYLVVEACEYNKSFLTLFPQISVVTNIEKEHMDSYENMFNLKTAFLTFLKRGGQRFVYLDNTTNFLKKYNNIQFVMLYKTVESKLKGEYNQKNIALAMAVCKHLGIDEKIILKAIKNFAGVPRRFECVGKVNSQKVFIDYAHHPTEVKCFLETFSNEYKNNQVVFQPHTYSRTKMFLKEFVEVLGKVENLIIYKEYPSREKPIIGGSARDLYSEILKKNPKAIYCDNHRNLIKNLKKNVAIAFVGAGDINRVAEKFVGLKKN